MSAIDSTPRSPGEPSRSRLRAESPPPHYWRRWTGDAPAAEADPPAAFPSAAIPVDTQPAIQGSNDEFAVPQKSADEPATPPPAVPQPAPQAPALMASRPPSKKPSAGASAAATDAD